MDGLVVEFSVDVEEAPELVVCSNVVSGAGATPGVPVWAATFGTSVSQLNHSLRRPEHEVWHPNRMLLAPAKLLLVDSALSRRESLEARVGNWLAALGGESIRPGREPCLGTLKRRELFNEVLGETCVELMLVEVLRASVARFVLFRSRFGILVARTRGRLVNSVPLAREELAGAIKIHEDRVSLRERHAEGARPDALDRCFPQPSERARKLARRCRFGRWVSLKVAVGGG
jgi:hypothetical protein